MLFALLPRHMPCSTREYETAAGCCNPRMSEKPEATSPQGFQRNLFRVLWGWFCGSIRPPFQLWERVPITQRFAARNWNRGPGLFSCLGKGLFYTESSGTAPEIVVFPRDNLKSGRPFVRSTRYSFFLCRRPVLTVMTQWWCRRDEWVGVAAISHPTTAFFMKEITLCPMTVGYLLGWDIQWLAKKSSRRPSRVFLFLFLVFSFFGLIEVTAEFARQPEATAPRPSTHRADQIPISWC